MNVIRFVRNWILPLAIATGIVVYLLFHFVPFLQPIGEWYAPYNDSVLPDFMFLVLFVTFCKVDFSRLLPVRWHLWIGAQQMVFALVLVGVILGLGVSGGALVMLEAILVCVVSPTASAAPVVTAKLGGSLEEMTTYTFLSNFISALLIPLCFPLLPQANGGTVSMAFAPLFFRILWKVSVVLLLPMIFAYFVKHYARGLHRRIVGVKDLSYYMWGCSLVVVSGTTAMNIREAWERTSAFFLVSIALVGLVLCVVQFATGRCVGHYFDKTNEAGQALGQKNTAFAIWVATAFLHPLSSVGPGCYILWQNIINSVEIWMLRRRGLERSS